MFETGQKVFIKDLEITGVVEEKIIKRNNVGFLYNVSYWVESNQMFTRFYEEELLKSET